MIDVLLVLMLIAFIAATTTAGTWSGLHVLLLGFLALVGWLGHHVVIVQFDRDHTPTPPVEGDTHE